MTSIAEDINAIKEDITLLKGLDHPNIVRYLSIDVQADQRLVHILLEYVPAGSVRTLLSRFGALDGKIVQIYIKQILEGLKYLHSKGIVHRNLKCSNVLVGNDATVKLSDFGASKRVAFEGSDTIDLEKAEPIVPREEPTEFSQSLKGSANWMAPEVVLKKGHHKSADVWSVGCVMIEMRTSNPPWSEFGSNAVAILQAIARTVDGPKLPENVFTSPELAFLHRCLRRRPEDRATVEELLVDPWIMQKDEKRDEHARQVVQQMSQTLMKESVGNTDAALNGNKEDPSDPRQSRLLRKAEALIPESKQEDAELSCVESDLESSFTGHRTDAVSAEITSKVAADLREKQKAQDELIKQQQEQQRRLWEEELQKELDRQKALKQ